MHFTIAGIVFLVTISWFVYHEGKVWYNTTFLMWLCDVADFCAKNLCSNLSKCLIEKCLHLTAVLALRSTPVTTPLAWESIVDMAQSITGFQCLLPFLIIESVFNVNTRPWEPWWSISVFNKSSSWAASHKHVNLAPIWVSNSSSYVDICKQTRDCHP